MFQGRAGTVLAFALGLVIATAGSATAAKLITGKQIKDRSIAERDLSDGVAAKLNSAAPVGSAGPAGEKGATGDAVAISCVSTGSHAFVAPDAIGDVLSIQLPAGKYVLQGQAVMTTTMTTTGYASQCWIGSILAPIGLAQAHLQGAAAFQDKATLPLTDTVDLSTETTLTMRCAQSAESALSPGTAMGSATGRLVAMKISDGRLHVVAALARRGCGRYGARRGSPMDTGVPRTRPRSSAG